MVPCCAVSQPCFHQRTIAIPGDLGEFAVRLGLLQRRLELTERRLGLCDLVVQLRRDDFGQQLPGLDPVTDIDFALVDIAAGARKDIGGRESRRGRRQADGFGAGARPHGRNTNLRDQVAALLRRGDRLDVAHSGSMRPRRVPSSAQGLLRSLLRRQGVRERERERERETALAWGASSHYAQHREVIATAPRPGPAGSCCGRAAEPRHRNPSACLRPRRLSRPPISLRAPAAISTSAKLVTGSRPGSCWPKSSRASWTTRSQAEATLGQLKAALQQAEANRELAKVALRIAMVRW